MPILAGFPVVPAPVQIDAWADFRESRTFAFRSVDGRDILPFTGAEFVAMWGVQNLDMVARQVVEEALPNQDGTELTDIKVGSRTWTIPIFVGSDSGHVAYLRNRARMRSFFNHRTVDYRSAGGTFDLVARSDIGERTLRSTYLDGMNGQWDQQTSGSFWETFGLQGLAVNPNWNGGRWSSQTVRQNDVTASWFDTFPAQLSARNVLNAGSTVTVEGDVDSWPVVDAVGPCSSLTVTAGDFVLDVPDGLAAGELMYVDTDPRTKTVTFNGAGGDAAWGRLSPLSIFAPLVPGVQPITFELLDPGTLTAATISGVKWYETPW